MSKHASDFAGVPVETADENVLLRAALAEAQRRISDLERNAESDSVTPLPGAGRFRAELERVVGLAGRHGTAAAMVGIELTGLAAIREHHGHFAGDAALVHVSPPALRPDPLDRRPGKRRRPGIRTDSGPFGP